MASTMLLVSFHILLVTLTAEAATTMDQSQTGELNVHVNLKDIRVIALMKSSKEEYVDYDYAYDYSEMTIKPQNGTTLKPLNVTNDLDKDNGTDITTEMAAASTLITKNSTSPLDNSSPTITPVSSSTTTDRSILPSSTLAPISESVFTKATTAPSSTVNGTECRKGYAVNKKGECELKLQPSSTNALLKLVKLSQKLKLRREN